MLMIQTFLMFQRVRHPPGSAHVQHDEGGSDRSGRDQQRRRWQHGYCHSEAMNINQNLKPETESQV